MRISKTRTFVPLLMFVPALAVAVGAEGLASAAPRASVTVAGVHLYNGNHFRYRDCTPLGHPQTAFHTTDRSIVADVQYSSWQGRHADRDRWYSPDGRLYLQDDPLTYNGNGPRTDCGFIRIAGTRGERLPGKWTYKLLVDGRVMYTSGFTISAP